MKLSIIIAVLNSHEIVRRQLLHFERIGLPEDVELLLMDDGSDPPLSAGGCELHNLRIVPTHDPRPWTTCVARNTGARMARGERYLMTDIDYIIPRDAIETARTFDGDKLRFRRQFGVLLEDGTFTQDVPTLLRWGLRPDRVARKGLLLPPHPNNFVMPREVFWRIGGYDERRAELEYPQGDDREFKARWAKARDAGLVREYEYRPWLYMFPNGQFCGDVDFNPFGLFHTLSRKTERNPYAGKERA